MRLLKFPHTQFHEAAYAGPRSLLTVGRQSAPYVYNAMRLWDLAGDESLALPSEKQRELCRLLFLPGGTAYIRTIGAWPESDPLPPGRHAATVERAIAVPNVTGAAPIAFGPDGIVLYCQVASVGGSYQMLFLLRTANRAVYELYRAPGLYNATRAEFSSDGRLVAVTAGERTVAVYDVATRSALREIEQGGKVNALTFVSDDRLAVAAARSVRLWDVTSGRSVAKLRTFRRFAEALAASHDGRLIAAGSLDGLVRVWDCATGREEKEHFWDIGPIRRLAYSPDGATAAAVGDDAVAVWDID